MLDWGVRCSVVSFVFHPSFFVVFSWVVLPDWGMPKFRGYKNVHAAEHEIFPAHKMCLCTYEQEK